VSAYETATVAAVLDLHEPCERAARELRLDVDPAFADATAATWLGRMVNEYRSGTVFERTAELLERAGQPEQVVAECRSFAAEERRHGVMCGAVVLRAGGVARAPIEAEEPYPLHADTSPQVAVVRNLIAISCMAETVAVALIGEERERMPEGPLRELLTGIWADEVGHARFGWRTVTAILATLDEASREAVSAYLPVAFEHLERHELAHLPLDARARAGGEAYGLCSGEEARELFYATVEHAVVAGLEALGLPARRAWEARHAYAIAPRASVGASTREASSHV
jgi:hypothetical protein